MYWDYFMLAKSRLIRNSIIFISILFYLLFNTTSVLLAYDLKLSITSDPTDNDQVEDYKARLLHIKLPVQSPN